MLVVPVYLSLGSGLDGKLEDAYGVVAVWIHFLIMLSMNLAHEENFDFSDRDQFRRMTKNTKARARCVEVDECTVVMRSLESCRGPHRMSWRVVRNEFRDTKKGI